MEKKTNRSVQSASKGLTTDSKKSQDATNKLWPRGGRRRETSGGSLAATKPEPSRKPNPQRLKTLDKRPRARNYQQSNPVGRTETTRLDDTYEGEFGSVFERGSKKLSLNHLLNFNVTPYRGEGRQFYDSSNKRGGGNRLTTTRKHKYNKEHYLQANCQFIVNYLGDYKQYVNNPDALVDWNLIEQVNVQVSEFSSCPICLYPPVAAKITRCGHVYCWSCILHYLALSDKTWRKCPICYDSVHKNDLKSVISIPHTTFSVNDTITFKLMKRQKGSLTTYPAAAIVKDSDMIFNLSEKEANCVHSKLLLANQSQIMSIIDREYGELKAQQVEDEQCPENCFVIEALNLLKERRDSIAVNNGDQMSVGISRSDRVLEKLIDNLNVNCGDGNKSEENEHSSDNSSAAIYQPGKLFYFYQASDGQHIYLHPINARMIEHTYGSLECGPPTLSGRILEKEGGSMTEELRYKMRYLQHLPLTCQFEVAEIQIREPVVSKETFKEFSDQIENRRKKRRRREQEEKRREKHLSETLDRQLGKYKTPDLHIESPSHFPTFEPKSRSDSESNQISEPNWLSTTPPEHEFAGPSFATMLASKKKVNPWPTLKSSSSSNTTPTAKVMQVTGSNMQPSSLNNNLRKFDNSDQEQLDDYETIPSCNSNLGDAIAQALHKIKEHEVTETAPSGASGKKNKKKKKSKVLFTTTLTYN